MKHIFQPGDQKTFIRKVSPEDCAAFFGKTVHPLYATYALARDAEWCCRLFVLDMKDEAEEGIGTFIEIKHLSPAPVNAVIYFTATIERIQGHEIICTFSASMNDKLIATGRQGQKILKKDKLQALYKYRI